MKYELMQERLEDVKLIEHDLLRELTSEEKEIVIENGWEYFLFEHLKIDREEYSALRKLERMLSCYINQRVFDMELGNEKNYEKVSALLTQMWNYFGAHLEESDDIDPCEGADDCVLKRYEQTAQMLSNVLNSYPTAENGWLAEYATIDINHCELIGEIMDYLEYIASGSDHSGSFDELCAKCLDIIKDTVIEHWAEKLLANKGTSYTLDSTIISEVADYLFNTQDNIRINVYNDTIKVY